MDFTNLLGRGAMTGHGGWGHGAAGAFNSQFRVNSMAWFSKPQLENGGKILLPASALDQLARLHIEYPMLFEVSNPQVGKRTFCGVLEFTAEEGKCYMPYWMMQNLLVGEGALITVKSATIPRGTYVKLQPHDSAFLKIYNPKAVLENTLRNFSCLTKDDVICIHYNNNNYYLNVLEVKPEQVNKAISIIETDVEVDFGPPLDQEEEETKKALEASSTTTTATTTTASSAVDDGDTKAGTPEPVEEEVPAEPEFVAFTGGGYRLDGKPIQNSGSSTSTSTSTPTSSSTKSSTSTSSRSAAAVAAATRATQSSSPSPTSSDSSTPVNPQVRSKKRQRKKKKELLAEEAEEAEKKAASFTAFSGKGNSLR